MSVFLRKAYASDDPPRYAIIPHKLRYPAISSSEIFTSLRYDRKKNFKDAIKTLQRNVIIINAIRFLCFMCSFMIKMSFCMFERF